MRKTTALIGIAQHQNIQKSCETCNLLFCGLLEKNWQPKIVCFEKKNFFQLVTDEKKEKKREGEGNEEK